MQGKWKIEEEYLVAKWDRTAYKNDWRIFKLSRITLPDSDHKENRSPQIYLHMETLKTNHSAQLKNPQELAETRIVARSTMNS